MYLAMHSYGEKIIYPWSYKSAPIEDWRDLHSMAETMAGAIFRETRGLDLYKVFTDSFYVLLCAQDIEWPFKER